MQKGVIISKSNFIHSLKIVFVLTNNVDSNEMQHRAAFHLGVHCLSKCAYRSHWYIKDSKWVQTLISCFKLTIAGLLYSVHTQFTILLIYFGGLYDKHYRPRGSLRAVWSGFQCVCCNGKSILEFIWIFAAGIKSEQHFQDKNTDRITVKFRST